MGRLAFGVEYDGSKLVGWQAQREGRSVQTCLQDALSTVADENLSVICAGRTDAGVHATAQVVHIDTGVERSQRGWILGGNSNLPDDINLYWARPVGDQFHARFSALSRTYQYLILNRSERSALWHRRTSWVRESLDADAMRLGAKFLLGEHDFSSFRASGCQAKTPVRTIERLDVERRGDLVSIVITADAFLHHMVRNIAGTLIRIGRGDADPGWAAEALAAQSRSSAGMTASASGLYLVGVAYDKKHGLPDNVVPAHLFHCRIDGAGQY
jgi:tRNA pseudouridine38-40 synthase